MSPPGPAPDLPDLPPEFRAPPAEPVWLEGVVADYGHGRDVPALVDVTLSLAAGATAIVHGGAGAGKTTLLHVLRGALEPGQGVVRVLGSDVYALPARVRWALRRRIGYIAQTPRLFAGASVFDSVAAPLRLAAGGDDPRIEGDVRELLAYLGLGEIAAAPAHAISDSQRRLAAAARAVVGRPDVVLADEPLAGLSADAAGRVLRLLSELARQGAAVVIVTQEPDIFSALASTRCTLERGRLTA